MSAKTRIQEARQVLKELGMPREQQNDRTALCLLSLLNLTPDKKWSEAAAPLVGITPMMEFARGHYGMKYAPNTRETFRRFSIHQMVQAGLVRPNPDNPTGFKKLGITLDDHGKMPDVVLYDTKRNWLLLVKVVTSHGPVNPKRYAELKAQFSKSKAGLVFVTAFPTRSIMNRYWKELAWETEVWVAESPDHMIHLNGSQFLGPYHKPPNRRGPK